MVVLIDDPLRYFFIHLYAIIEQSRALTHPSEMIQNMMTICEFGCVLQVYYYLPYLFTTDLIASLFSCLHGTAQVRDVEKELLNDTFASNKLLCLFPQRPTKIHGCGRHWHQ